ncbi:MAG: DUF6338 family protein [Bacillota bacterium]
MEEYIGLLLLITPGFLVQFLHKKFTTGSKNKSDFDKTINSLLYSVIILFINYLVISVFTTIETITDFKSRVNSFNFITKYIALTFASTIFFSVIWGLLHPKLTTKVINRIRRLNKLNKIEEKGIVWDIFLNDSSKHRAVKIYKGGQEVAKGFIKNWSFPQNEEQELILEMDDIMDAHSDCFDKIERVYYNLDKDILIKEYNLEKLYSRLNQQQGN